MKTGTKKGIKACMMLLLAAALASGCGEKSSNEVSDELLTDAFYTEQPKNTETVEIAGISLDEMFSDRDMEADFDENADAKILLKGDTAECTADGVQIDGSSVTITEEGTYIIEGELKNGSIVVAAEKSDKLQLVLNGVKISNASTAPLYIKQADKVFVTLAENTENVLCVEGEYEAIDENNIDAVIFSKEDLTLNGEGSLTLEAEYGHGIVSKDDLAVTGGNYKIRAQKHGLSGKDSVRIAGGSFDIQVQKDGIHSENKDDEALGFVYVAGGSLALAVGDDGIHAATQVYIADGNIEISESYEGIEGHCIDIAGGNISISSSDDGLNAAGESAENSGEGGFGEDPFAVDEEAYIRIAGGTLKITAYGDGIDSNGDLYVSGGEIYVSGPENGGNGSLDYAGEAEITGGSIMAVCISGMEQNFGTASTQGAILVQLSGQQEAGSEVICRDSDGNVLLSFIPTTKYSCVLISCPKLQTENTYTIEAGTESTQVELTSLIYGNGSMMGGMPGGQGFGREEIGGERPKLPEGFDQNGEGNFNKDVEGERPESPEGFDQNGEGAFDKDIEGERPELPKGADQNGEGNFDKDVEGERPEPPEGFDQNGEGNFDKDVEGERPGLPEGVDPK